eukprot:m.241140 g.241140  ORF g.241140 m.241140 type:complete len:169 (-) comp17445_c0_seq51:769-1275(-)
MLSLEMSKRPFPSLATLWQVIAGANTPPHSNMVCFPFVQEAGEKDQLADVALRLMKSASPSAKTAAQAIADRIATMASSPHEYVLQLKLAAAAKDTDGIVKWGDLLLSGPKSYVNPALLSTVVGTFLEKGDSEKVCIRLAQLYIEDIDLVFGVGARHLHAQCAQPTRG